MGCCRPLAGCMYLLTTAAVTNRPNARPPHASNRRPTMSKTSHSVSVAIVLATLATVSIATAPAQAAEVICKTNGAAQGCVAGRAGCRCQRHPRRLCRRPGRREPRRLYPRDPLWRAPCRSHPRVALTSEEAIGSPRHSHEAATPAGIDLPAFSCECKPGLGTGSGSRGKHCLPGTPGSFSEPWDFASVEPIRRGETCHDSNSLSGGA